MDLLLGQLVYTSFAGVGFKTIASKQVTKEAQQAFQRLTSKYWDTYNPLRTGYRAVYIHQITSEQTLFGWLYNDGMDDMGRGHVPHFIGYYLREPLLDFQLKNIFTCLHNGPVAVIDRHNLPVSLETKIIPDLWSYEGARLGVAVPSGVRAHCNVAMLQGELLDMFVPIDKQEIVVGFNGQTYEQQRANSIYKRYLIEGIGTGAAALENNAIAKTGAIRVYKKYDSTPVSTVVVHRENVLSQILNGPWQSFNNINSQAIAYHNAVLAYKHSQLLLKVGIAATVLALSGSIYGLLQTSTFIPKNPQFASYASSPSFYKTLAQVPNVPPGSFNYGGSTTFAPLRSTAVVSAIKQSHPQFQLRYAEPTGSKLGSGTGIRMLLKGELDFAQSSRPLKDSELGEAKKRGFTLEKIPVAIDGIAFYVNPQISVPGLSLLQVRDIFTGKITNWKEVGGPDQPITPFIRSLQVSGTTDFLKEKVLAGEEFSPTVQEVETTTESIRKVATTPGGIGYATASEVMGQSTIQGLPLSTITTLSLSKTSRQAFISPFANASDTTVNKTAFSNGSYPLTRQIFVIVKRDGKLDEQAGSAYANLLLTDEGQRLVEKAGFVAIR